MINLESALILPNLVSTLEDLVKNKNNSVNVQVPATKQGIAMAYDVFRAIQFLNPKRSFSFGLQIEDEILSATDDSRDYVFNIIAKGTQPLRQPEETFTALRLVSSAQTTQVRGGSIPPAKQEEYLQVQQALYGHLKQELPDRKCKVSLKFRCLGLTSFFCDLTFYDQEAIKWFKPKARKTTWDYPIADTDIIRMSDKAFEYIREPVYWSSLSLYFVQCYHLLLGERTIQDIAYKHKYPIKNVKKHTSKAMKYVLPNIAKERVPKSLVKKVRCPEGMRSIFLSKLCKTHGWAIHSNKSKLSKIYEELMLRGLPDLSPLTAAGFTKEEADIIVEQAKEFL